MPARTNPLYIFVLIWLGQSGSMLGSRLTSFALGVWAYQRSGDVTDFALVMICTSTFEALGLTVSGSVVDRRPAQRVMIGADLVAGLSSLGLALVYLLGSLELWHVCAAMAVNASCVAFQGPAFNSVTAELIPASGLGRANGMISAAYAGSALAAPFVGGLLIAHMGLGWIFAIDLCTFVFAVVMQLVARPPRMQPRNPEPSTSFRKDLWLGWKFIFSRRGLIGALAFMSVVGFLQAIAEVLFTPMILKQATVTQLGTTMSIIGVGILGGSVFVAVWGGPQRRVRGIIALTLVQAIALICAGLRPNLVLITASATAVMFFAPVISSINAALWQVKSPPDLLGRVYATRYLVAIAVEPIGQLVAGPLADGVFEPAMAQGGALAGVFGPLIGVGPGRGMGLMLSILGLAAVVLVVVGAGYRPLRHLDREADST